jgi:hypothetical protein
MKIKLNFQLFLGLMVQYTMVTTKSLYLDEMLIVSKSEVQNLILWCIRWVHIKIPNILDLLDVEKNYVQYCEKFPGVDDSAVVVFHKLTVSENDEG